MDAPFELTLPTSGELVRVVSVRGRERLSGGYRIDATVIAEGAVEDPRALLDQAARFTLLYDGAPARLLLGVVARVEDLGRASRDRRTLRLTVVPRAHRARLRRTRRIFQGMSTLAIAAAVFADHGAPVMGRLRKPGAERAYCVQYDESDWAFVTRLLAEEGYYFFFEHGERADAEVLVIADAAEATEPIEGAPGLRFERQADESSLAPAEDQVTAFVHRSRAGVASAWVHGYDFGRPGAPIESKARRGDEAAPARVAVEHEGPYEDDRVAFAASTRLEQARRKTAIARGETACRRLAPGRRFTLGGHEAPALDGDWAVTEVVHEAFAAEAAPGGAARYRCRFEAIRAGEVLRPRWKGARPRQVAETAVVVGPPGEEIYTDAFGRVKVRFHWDRAGAGDERSSCWLRVAQAWAGAGWGSQFVPRVGMEVVVTFLGGDPDRPLVTGCVVNATHPPPFELPEAAAVSGIRTRSTPASQGFNELRFDDRAGLEVLSTHAERDHHEVVGRDRAARVARDRSDEIGGSASTHVRGDASLRVEGAHAEQIGGGASTQVGGDRAIAVGGALSLEVGAGARARVGGDSTVDVRGRSSFVVGSAEEPGNREDYVFGRASLGASDALVLRSETSILLQCGDASVELLPGRITLRAPQIDVRAKERLRARAEGGPVVTLGEEVEVLASALRVFTDGAALELDEDAKLKGAQIKLGYDPSKPSRSDDDPPPETKPFRCKLSDYYLHPYARRRFHLVAQGLRFEGETDDEGVVAAEIPADTRQVSIRLWIGAYPEGRQRLYDLRVEELPPLAELRGVQARLKNLGYFTGPADGEESAALTKAVAEFQEDHRQSHDLQPTGALDEGTRGALEEIHGH